MESRKFKAFAWLCFLTINICVFAIVSRSDEYRHYALDVIELPADSAYVVAIGDSVVELATQMPDKFFVDSLSNFTFRTSDGGWTHFYGALAEETVVDTSWYLFLRSGAVTGGALEYFYPDSVVPPSDWCAMIPDEQYFKTLAESLWVPYTRDCIIRIWWFDPYGKIAAFHKQFEVF